jgi:hypothetical protein
MIQSQIFKNMEIFLFFVKNKTKKNLKSLKYTFKVENIMKILINFNFIKNRMEHSGNIFNLYFILCHPCFLLYVFFYLKKDFIFGTTRFINTITLKNLQILSKKLIYIYFQNKYTKKINLKIIKKVRKNNIKMLFSLKQLLNKSIFLLIQIKFNHQLSFFSYGFRSNTSCHTVLNSIQVYSHNINGKFSFGYLKFDFLNFFRQIHCKFLMQEIDGQIYDQKLLLLLNKMISLKSLNFYNYINNNLDKKEVIFQTPNIDFLLFNIFFNRLDFLIDDFVLSKTNSSR